MSWAGHQSFGGFPQKRLSPAVWRTDRAGVTTTPGTIQHTLTPANQAYWRIGHTTTGWGWSSGTFAAYYQGTTTLQILNTSIDITGTNTKFRLFNAAYSTNLSTPTASDNTLQMGLNAAAPAAQTFKGCDARAGTDTNTVGGDLSIAGGTNTGTGIGGGLLFKTAPSTGVSGTGAGTPTTNFQITGDAKLAWFGVTPVVKQTSGANLTNNVTAGGTTDQIDNYTDLTIYANDAAAIRNNLYQLSRKLKQVNDALRAYGLLT